MKRLISLDSHYGSRTMCSPVTTLVVKTLLVSVVLLGTMGQHADAQGTDQSPLPAPTGRHSVGRAEFEWIDQSRPDPSSPSRHREIIVWAWYPATPNRGADPAVWMPGKWGEVFWSEFAKGRPALTVRPNLSLIRTHAYVDAAVESSTRKFPVLLFAPGSGATPLDYSGIIEDLVSHGFIVLGVESDFGRASVFADGRVVLGHDPVERGARISTTDALHAWEEAARTFGQDLSFALAQLGTVKGVPFGQAADLASVGVFGHSLGGAAALQCAHDNPRVRAVFNLDGSPIWSSGNGALQKPVMVLSAASTGLNYDAVLSGATPGYHLRLAGTVHSFPSDVRVMPFFSAQAATSSQLIPPARALRVTATFLAAFFTKHLNGQPELLLNGPSGEYPEITFERGSSRAR